MKTKKRLDRLMTSPAFMFTLAIFACGLVAGVFCARYSGETVRISVESYVKSTAVETGLINVRAAFLQNVAYTLAVFILMRSPLAVVGACCVLMVRGFLLAFSGFYLMSTGGEVGLRLLLCHGFGLCLSLSALLLLSAVCFDSYAQGKARSFAVYLEELRICGFLIAVALCFDLFIKPILMASLL